MSNVAENGFYKVVATEFTGHDIDRLLQKSANYYNLSQNWTVQMVDFSDHAGIFYTGTRPRQMTLTVFWQGCLLEESVEGRDVHAWGKEIDAYWYMTEDGEWHRFGDEGEV